MPRKFLAIASIITILLAAFVLATVRTDNASADPAIDSEEQAFLGLINQWRAQNGLGPLQFTSTINNATEWMNNDMGTKGYFSHTDSNGQAPWDRMCNFGYCYNTWRGENIAAGYQTASQVFAAWKASSGHNANMLNPNYKVMGLSRLYVSGSYYGWYWTNDFGGVIPPNQPAGPTAAPTPAPTPAPTAAPTPHPTTAPVAAPTAAPGCPADTDCDGWNNVAEARIGTDPNRPCSSTLAKSDEVYDALPPDVNDDRVVNIQDWLMIGLAVGGTDIRYDLNMDGRINVSDMLMLNPIMFARC